MAEKVLHEWADGDIERDGIRYRIVSRGGDPAWQKSTMTAGGWYNKLVAPIELLREILLLSTVLSDARAKDGTPSTVVPCSRCGKEYPQWSVSSRCVCPECREARARAKGRLEGMKDMDVVVSRTTLFRSEAGGVLHRTARADMDKAIAAAERELAAGEEDCGE